MGNFRLGDTEDVWCVPRGPGKYLPVWLLVLLIPSLVLGQVGEIDDFEELDLEDLLDVVFTASKHEQSIIWSPSAITVFTREDIRASGATSLADLLRRVPGFDVYELSPSYPLVGARALTDDSNNLVLLVVDGREDQVDLAGFPLWAALTFDLEEVQRIEVIRGPGSTLYGANAFAAVVNITTVREDPDGSVHVLLSAGEQGQRRLFGRYCDNLAMGDGRLEFGLGVGTEGRRSAADRASEGIGVSFRSHGYLRYRLERRFELALHAGAARGVGNIFMHTGELRATHVTNHWVMASLESSLGEWVRLKAQLYHARYDSNFRSRNALRAFGIWMATVPDLPMDTHSADGQVQVDFQLSDDFLLIGGGNLRYTTLESEALLLNDDDEFRGAGFVHFQWNPVETLQLTGGLRLDLNTDTSPALSPRLVGVLRPWPRHAFRLGYALAFRKPSLFESRTHVKVEQAAFPEIIETLETQFGNEDLVNETVHSVEAGWRAHLLDDRLHLGLDLFYNVYLDKIRFDVDIPMRMGLPNVREAELQYENTGERIVALGGEAEISWRPSRRWRLWGNLGLREVSGDRSSYEPSLRVNGGGRLLITGGAFCDLALHFVSGYRASLVDPDNSLNPPGSVLLGNEFLLIARLGYRHEPAERIRTEAGLTLRAPLGRPFREYAGVPLHTESRDGSLADFGGEMLVRLVSFYLRTTF